MPPDLHSEPAEVYVTIGTPEKKELLSKEYSIPEDHILYSRSTSFNKAIRQATGDRGVDVVLNSLSGDALRESWDCLSKFGVHSVGAWWSM